MLDFVKIIENTKNNGRVIEILPVFDSKKRSKDIMTNGREFYAIWDEELGVWVTEFNEALRLIDLEIDNYIKEKGYDQNPYMNIVPKYVGYISSVNKQIDSFKQFCKDYQYKNDDLDTKLVFLNDKPDKSLHSSKRLPYDIKRGSIEHYDELMSTLYSKTERRKIEWAIGSILAGDSIKIQKFYVLYGKAGTGKSTVLNIIDMLFDGYTKPFKSSDLGYAAKEFALSVFSSNPLVLIEHDGDLSRIDDNTKLNSIASHERMMINEKYKKEYSLKPVATMFIGTNKPVKITDGRSGLLRRLIDISPSDNLVPKRRYDYLCKQIPNEIPAIAWHCLTVYNRLGIDYYKDYVPEKMKDVTDHFYDFILENIDEFKEGVTLANAFTTYKDYCDFSNVAYPYPKAKFKQEMLIYFTNFDIDYYGNGVHCRNFFSGFHLPKSSMVEDISETEEKVEEPEPFETWLKFEEQESLFDKEMSEAKAQLASIKYEVPKKPWDNCETTLHDIDTSALHYVKVPINHIVIDFDLKDEDGNKAFAKNLEAATSWPPTYAELSKSGQGIHLHYIYDGDPSMLGRLYAPDIEVKVFTGNSSLRRKLTKCNDIPIATIGHGLPMKKGGKMVSFEALKNESHLRVMIKKNLRKEIHPSTKPSIDFIFQLLDDAYKSGMHYDVTDMRPAIFAFAANSTNQSEYCLKKVAEMQFCSDDISEPVKEDIPESNQPPIVFYDVEVFPNLFLVNYKLQGEGHPVVRMINPSPKSVAALFKYRLVGFNCRRYDNHIMYARSMGYSNEELYRLSQRIVTGSANCFFREAYNLSYTDIYDYCSTKQSLKKWEIQLGIHHQELGLPWDKSVAEELWPKVAEYCDNDVIATEAVWNATQADFIAREILAEIAGGTVNDTTNSLTTKMIFGNDKKPQSQFEYRDLSLPVNAMSNEMRDFLTTVFPEMMAQPHGKDNSLLPYFPGYVYENGVSKYKEFNGVVSEKNPNGKPVGEGGLVWSKPGMYGRTFTFDVRSEHPHSVMAEYLFGKYTKIFFELVEVRVAIKEKNIEKARTMLNGVLAKYLDDESMFKTLAYALKIAINSVYGLTAAKFENAFHDIRNKDNIVAKRGALFMIDLKEEVEKRNGNAIHIKTDSIKVENPSKELIDFIFAFGKRYGYTFEVEHIFEKICLVNDAVYIGKLALDDEEWISDCKKAERDGKPIPTRWTATGTQFAVPYVFKTLFSHEPIIFDDMCETKEVQSSLYLDMNEDLPDVSMYEKELKERRSKGLMYKNPQLQSATDEELESIISKGHSLRFVGKVGQFCPIKQGANGGELVREAVNKNTGEVSYAAATGCKDYRWLESEVVRTTGKEDCIDESYYISLVDDAVKVISEYGDFEWFVSDDDDTPPFDGAKLVA